MMAWLSASTELRVSESNLRGESQFFMLKIITSLIHSCSALIPISHDLAKSDSAPQNCSYDSLSFCFLLSSLYRSNVIFVGLIKAAFSSSKNSLNEIPRIFTLGCF